MEYTQEVYAFITFIQILPPGLNVKMSPALASSKQRYSWAPKLSSSYRYNPEI